MDLPHPLGVASSQVVVDRDEVDALPGQAVEVRRQGGHERLALAGLHLGDPPEVQRRAAHHLDVVVTLADRAFGRLATDSERLEHQIVEIGTVVEPLAELGGLGLEGVVGQRADFGLEGVDVGHHALQRLDLLAFTGAEDAIHDSHAAAQPTGAARPGGSSDERRSSRCQPRAPGRGRSTRRRGGDGVQQRISSAGMTQCGGRRTQGGAGGDHVVDDDHPVARRGPGERRIRVREGARHVYGRSGRLRGPTARAAVDTAHRVGGRRAGPPARPGRSRVHASVRRWWAPRSRHRRHVGHRRRRWR